MSDQTTKHIASTVLLGPVGKTALEEMKVFAPAVFERLAAEGRTCLVDMSSPRNGDELPNGAVRLSEALEGLAQSRWTSPPSAVIGWDEREYERGALQVAADVVRLVHGLRDRDVTVVLVGPLLFEHELWLYTGVGLQLADLLLFVGDCFHLDLGRAVVKEVVDFRGRGPHEVGIAAVLVPGNAADADLPLQEPLESVVDAVLDLSHWPMDLEGTLDQDALHQGPRTYPGLFKILGLEPRDEDLRLLHEKDAAAAIAAFAGHRAALQSLGDTAESATADQLSVLLEDAVTVTYEHEPVFRRDAQYLSEFWAEPLSLVVEQAAHLVHSLSARSLRRTVISLVELGSFTYRAVEVWPPRRHHDFPELPSAALTRLLEAAAEPDLLKLAVAYATAMDTAYGDVLPGILRDLSLS